MRDFQDNVRRKIDLNCTSTSDSIVRLNLPILENFAVASICLYRLINTPHYVRLQIIKWQETLWQQTLIS